MAPVVVTPTELRQAAASIKNNWQYAWGDVSTLFQRLQECGGCAGTDRVGTKWAADYDPVAQDAVDAAVSYVIAIGQMHDLLEATAANHANANQLSVIGGAPQDVAFPPGSLEWMKRPEVPLLYGGDSGTPSWWDKIAAYVQGELWPNAHTDTLADAGTGWSWCAEQLGTHLNFQPAREAIGNQQSPEVQQILDQITLLETQGKALAAQFVTLAHGCVDYSIAVTDTHDKILKELGAFAALWVAGETVSWAAAELTFGVSVFAGNAALAARAAVVGSRIAGTIRALAATAEATGLPVIAASGVFLRTIDELTPLITSQASLLTAESLGMVNPLTQFDMNLLSRRPYLRKSTKDTVNAAADKTTVNGREYYISATDDNVLIPVSGKYDDAAITALPKDAKGEYYLGSNGVKYPVDSTPQYGHIYGHENWRLRDEALRRNPPMTWKEYCDYYNDPKHFRIEDRPGNSSHRNEMPK